ncbi:Golgi membrane protein 1-like [Cynoglossus semilaevis]|uniref:Golgi membrane protein 1 n=1 Tax=Cynoglossus semilaevis TaxID=244447 RepID=A0A3P8VUL3_CYNSE|nr:Golgi membrane protein 1-like [Cynoglossus semilaevis]XP_024908557.1 Golgi membrane protein 1-like [Cynoglossus semilaevis]XP_024908558.1 Golgi membrane protein 1-like [Cynoglossus semilaevis]XP_024908559.1 Golgi membrane protein 1-like [Cynoglossus semilaevis]
MGGLGNGRRGGRSPPLLIGALIACVLVLGFNYWVSSSRSLELQTKLYELEGQVRREAVDRGDAELKKTEFQEEIKKQEEEIIHIESFYKKQLEVVGDTCEKDKAILQQNISSSAKATQELRDTLNQLNDNLAKQEKDLQSCQGNINALNTKHTNEMSTCHSQVLSQKELCDEKVEAAKPEIKKKMEKLNPARSGLLVNNSEAGAAKEKEPVNAEKPAKMKIAVNQNSSLSKPTENKPSQLQTNDIIVDNVYHSLLKEVGKKESPSAAAVKQDTVRPPGGPVKAQVGETKTDKDVKNNLSENNAVEVMDVHEEEDQTKDAGVEGMLDNQGKAHENPVDQKLEEPDDYDAEKQIVEDEEVEKQPENKKAENIDLDMEKELADYNGDDENEGEFEADKQAELAQK